MHLAAAGREPGHPALSSCGHVGNGVDAFADGLGNPVAHRAPQGAYMEPGKWISAALFGVSLGLMNGFFYAWFR
ncbi:hypothetical protein ACUY2X_12830 [Corynebacterium minutissimum]